MIHHSSLYYECILCDLFLAKYVCCYNLASKMFLNILIAETFSLRNYYEGRRHEAQLRYVLRLSIQNVLLVLGVKNKRMKIIE